MLGTSGCWYHLKVSNYELYRFITEELFLEEKDDMRVPGMMSSHIYLKFYPKTMNMIQQALENFELHLDKTSEHYLHYLNSEAEKQQYNHFRKHSAEFELGNQRLSMEF